MSWMAVWTRAVIAPALRRALPAWVGAGIVAAVIGGRNGMMPRDVTRLALHVPMAGAVLAGIWILLIVPAARVLVRQDGAAYLRSLPAPPVAPRVAAIAALVAIQLPWLLLWLAGEGALGLVVVGGGSLAIAAIAAWPVRVRRPRAPRWRSLARALVGVHARALVRRAGHALVRGAGIAVLAGAAGGLVVRNNDATTWAAGVLAAATIAIVLVPGWAGALVPLVDSHRASAWLASSLGAGDRARAGVLAAAVTGVYLAGGAIAATVAIAITGEPAIAPVVLATALGTGLVTARGLAWAERTPKLTAARAVIAAVGASALAVAALGLFGATGALALLALGAITVLL